MTMMIPEECIDTSPVAKALHHNLYSQLGPKYKIIQHLKSTKDHRDMGLNGSLFWVQYKTQSLFIYLSDTSADFFDDADNSDQNKIKNRLLINPEFMALTRFQSQLLPEQLQSHKAKLIPFFLIFTNVEKDKLNIGIKSLGFSLFGQDKLESKQLNKLISNALGESLSPKMHHHIRCRFSPELTMYSHQVDNCLLDTEQEIALKFGMAKQKDESRYEHLNLRGVNGGIHSGKSEVVIQRAKLIHLSNQAKQEKDTPEKVLILTPDDASQLSLNKRYYALNPTDRTTEILSLSQLCSHQLKSAKAQLDDDQVAKLTTNMVNQRLEENDIGITLFFQELNFILGRLIFSEDDYLSAKRPVKHHELSEEQYKHIWYTYLTIKNELSLKENVLQSELPQLLWDILKESDDTGFYDHIFIDDAHLFPPIAFDLVKKLLKPESGQLFIAQDPSQLAVNSCILWKDTGLDLRGHSTRLVNNYQINPYILNAASSFYLHRLPDNLEKIIHRNLPEVTENPIPQLLHFHSNKDEENRLLNKIKNLVHNDVPLNNILLISIESELINYYENILSQTLEIPVDILKNGKKISSSKGLGICSLLHAHGQNAQHVFIVGINHIYEMENKHNVGTDEHTALLIDNTNKLTMAMTCAKKELTLLITTDEIPSDFISPHIDIPNMNSESSAEIHSLYA